MTDIHQGTTNGASGRNPWSYLPWIGALIAAGLVLYIIVVVVKPGAGASLQSLAHGEMAKLSTAQAGAPAPATAFLDPQGHDLHLADLKGKVLVVNLWATWCAPCVREMPTLAKLQAAYPGRIVVAPISMDKDELRERARAFIAEHAPLVFYQDPKLALPFALAPPAEGFPTTIIYGADGKEKARLTGPADWGGPDAKAVIEAVLAKP